MAVSEVQMPLQKTLEIAWNESTQFCFNYVKDNQV